MPDNRKPATRFFQHERRDFPVKAPVSAQKTSWEDTATEEPRNSSAAECRAVKGGATATSGAGSAIPDSSSFRRRQKSTVSGIVLNIFQFPTIKVVRRISSPSKFTAEGAENAEGFLTP
jgi:hypothetical protein